MIFILDISSPCSSTNHIAWWIAHKASACTSHICLHKGIIGTHVLQEKLFALHSVMARNHQIVPPSRWKTPSLKSFWRMGFTQTCRSKSNTFEHKKKGKRCTDVASPSDSDDINQMYFSNHQFWRTRRIVCFKSNFCISWWAFRSALLMAASAWVWVLEVFSLVSFLRAWRRATLAWAERFRSKDTTSIGLSSVPSASSSCSSSASASRSLNSFCSKFSEWICSAMGCPMRCWRFTSRQISVQSTWDATIAFSIARARSTSSTFLSIRLAFLSEACCSASNSCNLLPWSARIRSTRAITFWACWAFNSTALFSSSWVKNSSTQRWKLGNATTNSSFATVGSTAQNSSLAKVSSVLPTCLRTIQPATMGAPASAGARDASSLTSGVSSTAKASSSSCSVGDLVFEISEKKEQLMYWCGKTSLVFSGVYNHHSCCRVFFHQTHEYELRIQSGLWSKMFGENPILLIILRSIIFIQTRLPKL